MSFKNKKSPPLKAHQWRKQNNKQLCDQLLVY